MSSSKKYPGWFTSEVRKAVKIALAQGESKDYFAETALTGAVAGDFSFLSDEKLASAKELAETGATDLDSVSIEDFAAQVKVYLTNTAKTLSVKPKAEAKGKSVTIESEAPLAEATVAGGPLGTSENKSVFARNFTFTDVVVAVILTAIGTAILCS
jgi:hypothetical protein